MVPLAALGEPGSVIAALDLEDSGGWMGSQSPEAVLPGQDALT